MASPTSPTPPATHISRTAAAGDKFLLQKYDPNSASGTFKFRGETYRISLQFADGPHGMVKDDFKKVLEDINTLIGTTITYDAFAKADVISIKDRKIKTHTPASGTTAEKEDTKEIADTDAASETLNKIYSYAITHRFAPSSSSARRGSRDSSRDLSRTHSRVSPSVSGVRLERLSGSDSDSDSRQSPASGRRVRFIDTSRSSSSESSDGYSSEDDSDEESLTRTKPATAPATTATTGTKPAAPATGSGAAVSPATVKATPPKATATTAASTSATEESTSIWRRHMPTWLGGAPAKATDTTAKPPAAGTTATTTAAKPAAAPVVTTPGAAAAAREAEKPQGRASMRPMEPAR